MNTFKQKAVAVVSALTISSMLAMPVYGETGQTVEELQAQIQDLLALVASLQQQLAALQGGGGAAGYTCTFTRPLYPGVSGEDVRCLQQSLNALGHQVAASGPGSPGNETQFYGPLTQAAVKAWQDAVGVVYGAFGGYFGPVSQAKYNELKAAAPAEEEVPPAEEEEVPAEEEEEAPAEEITTPGVEAIVSAEYAPSPANNAVVREGEEKAIVGIRVKVKQGDALVERFKLDLGTSSRFYTRQFDELAVFYGDEELTRVALSSNTVVKDGSRYVVTLNFSKLVKAGETADFTIKGKAKDEIDTTYVGSSYDPVIYVPANGVRALDGAGINQYAPSSNLSNRTVDLQQSEAEQAELTLSRDASYPKAYRAVSDSQGEADHVVMTIVNLKAKKGKVKITDWVASISEDSAGSSSASTGYLYRKQSDGSWKLLASASLSSNGFTWSDLTDEWVEEDATNTYKIEVKFTGASSDESTWTLTTQKTDITAENALGDSVNVGGSNVTSESVYIASVGPVYTLVGTPTISYKKATVSGASGTLEGSFTVRVTAEGADIYMDKDSVNNGVFQITVLDDDGSSSSAIGSVTYNQPSGSVSNTNTWQIPENESVDFTVNFAVTSGAIDAVSGFDLGEMYKLRMTQIAWGTADSDGDANTDTFMDTSVWETNFVFVTQ